MGHKIRLCWALLVLVSSCAASANDGTALLQIKAGHSALLANRPREAMRHFTVALATPPPTTDARIAALVGLGRAQLWLGEFRAAARTFRQASAEARTIEERCTADGGTAAALNALERHDEAYDLLAPAADCSVSATEQMLRARIGLGMLSECRRRPKAAGCVLEQGPAGGRVARLKDAIDFLNTNRIAGLAAYSADSAGEATATYGTIAWLPGIRSGAHFDDWRVAATSSQVSDNQSTMRLYEVSGGGAAKEGYWQRGDVALGAGASGGWQFLEGHIEWLAKINGIINVNASAAQKPVLTTAALIRHVLYDDYSASVEARVSDHWRLEPAFFDQQFTDGNRRIGASARLVASPFDVGESGFALGGWLYVRGYRNAAPFRESYFSPARYREAQVGLIGVRRLGNAWRLRITLSGGEQSVDGEVNPAGSVALSASGSLPGNGRLDLGVGFDSYDMLLTGRSGYWSRYAHVSLIYPL